MPRSGVAPAARATASATPAAPRHGAILGQGERRRQCQSRGKKESAGSSAHGRLRWPVAASEQCNVRAVESRCASIRKSLISLTLANNLEGLRLSSPSPTADTAVHAFFILPQPVPPRRSFPPQPILLTA